MFKKDDEHFVDFVLPSAISTERPVSCSREDLTSQGAAVSSPP
jgi:hypothetical protein